LSKGKRLIQRVFALCFVLVLTACGASKLEKQLDLGAKYLEDLDYDNAIAAYTAAIDVDPASIDAYVGLAKAYEEKSFTIDDANESLDTLLLAYNTVNDVLSDSKTEYVGINESLDSVNELRNDIEISFLNEYFETIKDLSSNKSQDEIEALQEKYAEYLDNFKEEPKTIDEIDIDEESKKVFEGFLNNETPFIYHSGLVDASSGYNLDEVLANNTSYTFGAILSCFDNYDIKTNFHDISFIDCGLDGKYELLLNINYNKFDVLSFDYDSCVFHVNQINLVLQVTDNQLEVIYIGECGKTHFYDEEYESDMKIYYNGLVYWNGEIGGSEMPRDGYSFGIIDADGGFSTLYEFDELDWSDSNYDE